MPTKRVLVIDDEAPVQEVVQSCFEELAGWEVLTSNSGRDGLEKAAAEQPDAIILDVMMPEMDGVEYLTHLKANPETCWIPVVLLTAKVDLLQPSYYANLGVTGAIAKPFNPILLAEQVAQLLGWTLEV